MPRGKKRKPKNNQDAMTTRLMQISLKMDDHIYYNKLISVTAAEEYLQEIASLKIKCPRSNVRALQVIEKLTRCMKGIIAEGQTPAEYAPVPHVEAYPEFPEPCSPVYSLPDEDKTELLSQANFINDNRVIDLTEDDTAIQDHDNLIEKVKIAISNMGLRDEEQIVIADDDCSQSILVNYQNDNTGNEVDRQPYYYSVHGVNNQPKALNVVAEATNNRPDDTVLVQDCSQSALTADIFNNQKTKCSETNPETEIELYQNITKSNLAPQHTATNEINNTITINNPLATPQPKFFVEAPTILKKISNIVDCNIETVLKSPVEQPTLEAKKENKRGRRKKNKEESAVTEKQKSQSRIKNKAKTTNKVNHPCKGRKAFNIVHGKGVVRSDSSVDKPQTAIYNQNVECDLSWVENLRYVREISPEENDTTLSMLDDNFWNNYSLPDKWNDRDFDV